MTTTPQIPIVLLTHAEFAVARAFAFDGAANKVIGSRLFITEDTVKSHMKAIIKKIGVHDRSGVAVAIWSGDVDVVHLGSQRLGCADCGQRHLLRELWQLREANLAADEVTG